MAIKKFCRCGKIILKRDIYCQECKEKYSKIYNRKNKVNRKDFEVNKFYSTARWIRIRDRIRLRDRYLCLYCYIKNMKLSSVTVVHHIIPFKEDDKLKYDKDNLICLCRECHDMIHNEYDIDEINKNNMQNELKKLVVKSDVKL